MKKKTFAKTGLTNRRNESCDTKCLSGTTTERFHRPNEFNNVEYSNLCPVSVSVSYLNGYSSLLKQKSRPMLDYTSLKLKT